LDVIVEKKSVPLVKSRKKRDTLNHRLRFKSILVSQSLCFYKVSSIIKMFSGNIFNILEFFEEENKLCSTDEKLEKVRPFDSQAALKRNFNFLFMFFVKVNVLYNCNSTPSKIFLPCRGQQ
jgi:hypothetical protein